MTAFQITAYFDSRKGQDAPQQVKIQTVVADIDTADAIAAQFPKSCRVFTCEGRRWPSNERFALVATEARLVASGNNGGKNETGIKRYRAFIAKAIKLGYTVEFVAGEARNSYQTAEAFESAIA